MVVTGDPLNSLKRRIFSMIFEKNPVKSILSIWSHIKKYLFFNVLRILEGAKNGLFALCSVWSRSEERRVGKEC